MDWSFLSDPKAWIGLVTLVLLEIVLGIDNIIFISILASKLPEEQRDRARRIGLMVAMVSRIILVLFVGWIATLTRDLFHVFGMGFSGRDLILLFGGLFLIGKATHEIHNKLEGADGERSAAVAPTLQSVLIQILIIDLVFSFDSVITAVGMVPHIPIMVAAVVISVLFMLWYSGPVSKFVMEHPTVKMLALAFLILIGFNLTAEAFGYHIPKGYTYFAMAFSFAVEMLNLRLRRQRDPVQLHQGIR